MFLCCCVVACVMFTHLQEHILIFNIHHSVSDGWSWGIFSKELAHIYTNMCNGVTYVDELPVLRIDYFGTLLYYVIVYYFVVRSCVVLFVVKACC